MLIAQRQFSAIGELVLSDKKGHIVVQALQTLGQTQVWCTVIEHLDEYERALLHVALNRLAETGDWEVEV